MKRKKAPSRRGLRGEVSEAERRAISERITEVRQHAGLNWEQFGVRLGGTPKTAGKWSRPPYPVPSGEALRAMVREFRVSVDWLLGAAVPREVEARTETGDAAATFWDALPSYTREQYQAHGWSPLVAWRRAAEALDESLRQRMTDRRNAGLRALLAHMRPPPTCDEATAESVEWAAMKVRGVLRDFLSLHGSSTPAIGRARVPVFRSVHGGLASTGLVTRAEHWLEAPAVAVITSEGHRVAWWINETGGVECDMRADFVRGKADTILPGGAWWSGRHFAPIRPNASRPASA